MQLEPEQLALLRTMVEESKAVDRSRRSYFLFLMDSAYGMLQGPGAKHKVIPHDVEDLAAAGLLTQRPGGRGSTTEYTVAPAGFELVAREAAANPVAQVEAEVLRFIDSSAFRASYPTAHARWQEAAALLWSADADAEMTTIGHKTREATQGFATALVERHSPPGVDSDPVHTVARLRSVIDMHRERLGEARHHLLTALIAYWGEVSDLLQRQEHGGQKEGEPLTWEDGRRAVFQTLIVMYEVDRTL